MKRYVDLHLHTTFSDGVFTPDEVIRQVADAGIAACAIADHDNIDGIEAALAAGQRHDVEVLTAVELSVVYQEYQDIHLLGYGFDHKHAGLAEALREFQDFRKQRNEQIVERINEKLASEGWQTIDYSRVRSLAGGTVGRPHIARALLEKGLVRDVEDAFQRYLIPCNVPKRYFPIDEAIALIHDAGGAAILAHPPFITPDRKVLCGLLDTFMGMGLDGVEAYNSGASNDDIDWYITQARRRNMIVTGGSDFHGIEGGQVKIGGGRGNLKIPYRCVEEIRIILESQSL